MRRRRRARGCRNSSRRAARTHLATPAEMQDEDEVGVRFLSFFSFSAFE